MSLTKVLVAIASITVCAASLPCHATTVPSSSVQLSIPAKYAYRAMIATFTPPGGLTLSAYATDLGFIGFNWQQTITNWSNPDLSCDKCGLGMTSMLIVPTMPTGPFPAFLDPYKTGYTYNPCGGTPNGSSAAAYPFYYTPTTQGVSTDCWSLVRNETPTQLKFGDEPMDPELTSTQIKENNVPKFMTTLVGIKLDGTLDSLFSWTWKTTYNGSVGPSFEVATTANSPDDNPGFGGTGRVTITSINGVPVPEPSGLSFLIPGTLAILAAHQGVRRRRPAPGMIRL